MMNGVYVTLEVIFCFLDQLSRRESTTILAVDSNVIPGTVARAGTIAVADISRSLIGTSSLGWLFSRGLH